MATLVPIYQKFIKIYKSRILSVTKVRLVSTSDSFTLPLAIVVSGVASVGQLRSQNENQIASTSQNTSTGLVTLNCNSPAIGQTVTVIGLHVDNNFSSVG